MARRAKGRSKVNRKRQRDLTTIHTITRRKKYIPTRLLGALPLADLRTFTPSPYARRALRDTGIPAAVGITPEQRRARRRVLLPTSISFINPRRVTVCIRRKVRKEVIMATTGGGKTFKRRRRKTNPYSHIKC